MLGIKPLRFRRFIVLIIITPWVSRCRVGWVEFKVSMSDWDPVVRCVRDLRSCEFTADPDRLNRWIFDQIQTAFELCTNSPSDLLRSKNRHTDPTSIEDMKRKKDIISLTKGTLVVGMLFYLPSKLLEIGDLGNLLLPQLWTKRKRKRRPSSQMHNKL